jgi:DNA-binding NarL/FixJ family response regulator
MRRETVLPAVRSGAHGFLRKEISPEGLVRALRGVVLSEFTVKRHVQYILQKLELSSRRAAATLYGTAFGSEEAAVAATQMP